MNEEIRCNIYGFSSRVFADNLDLYTLKDLKASDLLPLIGEETSQWFETTDLHQIKDALNEDFTSLFLMNNPPIESAVIDNKNEVLVGLQNPVVNFYHKHGYKINLSATHINTPDHLCIELGFMEFLIREKDRDIQIEFLEKHLGRWAIPFLIGCKVQAKTPFFREFCDFCVEFLVSDYSNLKEQIDL